MRIDTAEDMAGGAPRQPPTDRRRVSRVGSNSRRDAGPARGAAAGRRGGRLRRPRPPAHRRRPLRESFLFFTSAPQMKFAHFPAQCPAFVCVFFCAPRHLLLPFTRQHESLCVLRNKERLMFTGLIISLRLISAWLRCVFLFKGSAVL